MTSLVSRVVVLWGLPKLHRCNLGTMQAGVVRSQVASMQLGNGSQTFPLVVGGSALLLGGLSVFLSLFIISLCVVLFWRLGKGHRTGPWDTGHAIGHTIKDETIVTSRS